MTGDSPETPSAARPGRQGPAQGGAVREPARDGAAPALLAGAAALGAALLAAALAAPLWAQALAGGAALLATALWPRVRARIRARLRARRPVEPPPPGAAHGDMPYGLGRVTLERLPSAIVLIAPDGRIAFANAAAGALFERLRPDHHYSQSFRSPKFLDALNDAMASGGAREVEFTLHSDRSRVIHAHVQSATPDQGYVLCLFEERTRALRAEQIRTDFIANASHELKTPLASIKGFVETLQGPARDDSEARERFLGIMLTQTARMQRLVDDLLSLNRIEINEHIPPSETVDLGVLVQEAADALDPVAARYDAPIRLDLPVGGPLVRGDRDQLSHAVGNLMENAVKYGAGAPVRVAAPPPSPDFPGMIGLSVIDAGEGIAREHIPRLTERFYRISVKRSRDRGGTGLGLAIVKHILSRHRGELSIESEPGKGSRFTMWLPRATPDAPEPAPAPVPAPEP